jgi:2-(1,2-epoxy-1,2-dihydrophenyl)acetyl-CoA isomerase
MPQTIAVTKDAGIASIVLTRPDCYNALDLDAMEEMAGALVSLGADDAVRAVVVTGAGRAFCAGGDLRWAAAFAAGAPAAFHELATRFHVAIGEIRRMAKPVIAAINGPAAGGGFSLALACDLRIMEESAVLKQGYTSSGLCLDGGASHTLPRIVGLARALEIVAFDPVISAHQAESWGLVTRIVPDGEALAAAQALARELARGAVNAFAACKRLITDSFDSPLESQLERERSAIARCAAHADGREGLAAFVGRRTPDFATDQPR